MKKLMIAVVMVASAAFGGYESVELTPTQAYDRGAAKVAALEVRSTDADAQVSVFEVSEIASYTNANVVTSVTTTNIVVTPAYKGVYARGMFVYTNTTDTTYVNANADDLIKWNAYGTNGWYVITNICNHASVTNTAYSMNTNTFYVGGKSYDWTTIRQTPSVSTNVVTTVTTNVVTALKAKATVTNTIATATCVNGFGVATPTNAFITGGMLVTSGLQVSGEAVKATLIIKK